MDKQQLKPQYPVGAREESIDDGTGCCNVTVYQRCDGCPYHQHQQTSVSKGRDLPPLPKPFAGFQRNKGWGGTLEQVIPSAIGQKHVIATYTAKQMQAYAKAALAQPPSASDERERYVKWLSETYPDIYTVEDAQRLWSHEHISALAWEARAALAPSPGVDAAQPWKDLAQHLECCRTCAEDSVGSCTEGETLKAAAYRAPSPAASADEWMAEAERLVDHYADAAMKCETFAAVRDARAALLAHLKARP